MSTLADLPDALALGLATAFSLPNLFYIFIGVSLGTLVGVLPGIGSLSAVALLLPLTFRLDPTSAVLMLAGVFYGSTYGGSTAAILLNLPGTPATAVTSLDGYPMAQQGRAAVALLMTTIASFCGASVGIVVMILFSPIIADAALNFGPAEYFSLMLLGLVAGSAVSSGSAIKGIIMVVFGVALGLIGADLETGQPRFTFGLAHLYEGLNIVVVAIGLFGIAELVASSRTVRGSVIEAQKITLRSMIPTRADIRNSILPVARGSAIGSFFGTLPGTGGVLASFMAYAVEKRVARDPSRFGHGAIEGIMGPEAANNAADQTAFIPTMTLGIPGNVIMALIIGALMMHGVVPGPRIIVDRPELFWGLIMSFWVGNVILLILNIPMVGVWVRILSVPQHILYPVVLSLVCLGVYSVQNSYVDVLLAAAFGVFGYVLRLLSFQPAPLLLGFVLGPMIEKNLRRALLISDGDFAIFVERPISLTFIVMTFALLLIAGLRAHWSSRRRLEA